jgi:hypothetical protein
MIKIKKFNIIIFKTFYILSCSNCNSVIGKVNLPPEALYRGDSVSVSLEGADRTAYLNDKNMFAL